MAAESTTSTPVIAVLGARGFVGEAVVAAASSAGLEVRRVAAPRLVTSARTVPELTADAASRTPQVAELAGELQGARLVVNAAGIADASAAESDGLFGANALLPVMVRAACAEAGVSAFTHLSSAAVQGRTRRLTETSEVAPFSPYSASKALAEQALLGVAVDVGDRDEPRVRVYRATSVQGRDRAITQRLSSLASSRWASVARPGDRPTPQILVENLADGVLFATTRDDAPALLLHPHEGLTTEGLLVALGGRRPHHVPASLARMMLAVGYALGSRVPRAASTARRLEMLWFGQEQDDVWLQRQEWTPPRGPSSWIELRAATARP